MISRSGGLNPRAVAGKPSVTKLTHNSCTGIKASGIPRAAVKKMLSKVKVQNRLSEQVIFVHRKLSNFSAISWREEVTFDEMMMFALYLTNTLFIYSASSLKHQSDGSRAAANTNLMVFSLVWSELEPMIYCTQGEHANQYPISLCQKMENFSPLIN